MIQISKTISCEVAHFLPGHPIEKFSRVHGHSIYVTVTAQGAVTAGMVDDFSAFGAQVDTIVKLLDHRLLNELDPPMEYPTLENIAEWIAVRMSLTGKVERKIVSVKVDRPSCGESATWFRDEP